MQYRTLLMGPHGLPFQLPHRHSITHDSCQMHRTGHAGGACISAHGNNSLLSVTFGHAWPLYMSGMTPALDARMACRYAWRGKHLVCEM